MVYRIVSKFLHMMFQVESDAFIMIPSEPNVCLTDMLATYFN